MTARDRVNLVASWESRSKKWFVDLYRDVATGYSYRGRGCGGYLGALPSDACAIAQIETRVERGDFQPDANTTPMRRVK